MQVSREDNQRPHGGEGSRLDGDADKLLEAAGETTLLKLFSGKADLVEVEDEDTGDCNIGSR